MNEATRLLNASHFGNTEATNQLVEVLRTELRDLAATHLRNERAGHTLQPTALVHEAFLRLIDQTDVNWQNTSHFLAITSQLMRRILVDYARSKGAKKRGGEFQRVMLTDTPLSRQSHIDVVEIDELLQTLQSVHPRPSQVVDLHVFGGLKLTEIAELLGVSLTTIKKDWRFAKAWLAAQMKSKEIEP